MNRTRIEINVQTGERTERPFTKEEEAEFDRMIAEAAEQKQPPEPAAEVDEAPAAATR